MIKSIHILYNTNNFKNILTTGKFCDTITSAHIVLRFGGVDLNTKQARLIHDSISDDIIEIAEALAIKHGARNVTVRKILNEMGVTNRVFYNRYHNLNEVLEIVYRRAVLKMRESIKSEYDITTDFYNYVMDVAVKVLVNTYDVKQEFSQYMFEFDSSSDSNRKWWTGQIVKIIDIAKKTGQIKDVDSEMLSYTVWAFFRGYNADAVNRKLSKEDAVKYFKFGLNCLIDGIKN